MANEMKYVICPCCKATVPSGKFCSECGSALGAAAHPDRTAQALPAAPVGGFFPSPNTSAAKAPEREARSDAGLILLVNTCKKTVATVGGDGYTEIVLYLDAQSGEYWLHTYSKYVYMPKEAHASYAASPTLAKQAMDYIERNDLASWKEHRGMPLCGGDYIIRFRYGDETIRLDSGMMYDGLRAYTELSKLLYAGATEENRRYKDESR